jgi:hypothetical protein
MLLCGCRNGQPLITSLSVAQAGGRSVCKQHAARLWLTRPRGVTDTLLDMLSQVSQLHTVCGYVSNNLGCGEQQMNGVLLCHIFYAGKASDDSAFDLQSGQNMLKDLVDPSFDIALLLVGG